MSRLRFAHRTMASLASRPQKSQGDISAVFTSLRTDPTHAFPPRFAELKRKIWNKGLEQSWKEVLAELDVATERIAVRGEAVSCCRPCPWPWLTFVPGDSASRRQWRG